VGWLGPGLVAPHPRAPGTATDRLDLGADAPLRSEGDRERHIGEVDAGKARVGNVKNNDPSLFEPIAAG